MDKYELSIKEDKIRKHAEKKDFATAAKIADTIDWRKVKNIKMLTLVSQIYEKVKNYTEAKNVLLIAYERVPVGRRMLYKLTELCVNAGNLDEAEEFFEEFQEIAPNDIGKLILAYQIESARGEPIDKLITILELYRKNEFEEKWAYELACLYHKAGRAKECVQLCNEIILWFSVGPYVDKAMELKMQYEPLTPAQQEKMTNKKKYEARIEAVKKEFEAEDSREGADAGTEEKEPDLSREGREEAAATIEPEATEEAVVEETDDVILQNAQFREIEANLAQAVRAAAEKAAGEETGSVQDQQDGLDHSGQKLGQTREFLNEVSAALAASVSAASEDGGKEEAGPGNETPAEAETAAEESEETAQPAGSGSAEATDEAMPADQEDEWEEKAAEETELRAAEDGEAEWQPEAEEADMTEEVQTDMKENASQYVEMQEKEDTVQQEYEYVDVQSGQTDQEPEAENRITCVVVDEEPGADRIAHVIEKLKKTHEILRLPMTQAAKISGVKLNAKGIHATLRRLEGRDLIVDNAADMSAEIIDELVETLKNPALSMVIMLVDSPARMDDLLVDHPELDKLCVYLQDENQMSLDDFVACAREYAESEECVIDEMGGLALYAAAERMRNDGVQLTEEEARNLVDEAIDKAEHRGLKGLFGSRYDKRGYLILKEQFFKNL